MSDFNSFGENQQGNSQGEFNNSFGSTPDGLNNSQNFGGQPFNNQNFGGQPQNFGGQQFNDSNFGGQQFNDQNFGGNYSQGTPMYNQNNGSGNTDLSKIQLWKTLSIVQIIVGCCGGLIPLACGIVSLIFMNKSKDSFMMNNMIDANANFKTGKIFNLVGWGIMVLGLICNILLMITGMFSEMFG